MQYKPGIRQRGDSFQFIVSVGFDGNGKQVRKYQTYQPPVGLTGRQLKKVVEAAYDDFYIKATSNQAVKENMRFSELGDLYFSQYAPNCLKEITAYTYEGSYRKKHPSGVRQYTPERSHYRPYYGVSAGTRQNEKAADCAEE